MIARPGCRRTGDPYLTHIIGDWPVIYLPAGIATRPLVRQYHQTLAHRKLRPYLPLRWCPEYVEVRFLFERERLLVGRTFNSVTDILFPASSGRGRKATRIGNIGSFSRISRVTCQLGPFVYARSAQSDPLPNPFSIADYAWTARARRRIFREHHKFGSELLETVGDVSVDSSVPLAFNASTSASS